MASPEPAFPHLEILPTPPAPAMLHDLPQQAAVSRPHLVRQLEEGARHRLTLLIAPAGWGKTSLLAEWLRSTQRPVIWLPLESGDDEPSRLLRLFAQALNATFPGLANDLLAITRAPAPPGEASLLDPVIAILRDIAQPFTLVIDDVQHLGATGIQHALQELSSHLPRSASLVLSGRSEPPLSIARWRAQGEVTELRLDDLRFSMDEARALFATRPELHTDHESIATILERTEGWAAGLHLAGIMVRGQVAAEIPRIANLQGTRREVAAFLCEEVLGCQPQAMRHFLMRMALFDPLPVALANAVLERDDAATILERATAEGLFVAPLDQSRQVYRIHPLFREYLCGELVRFAPEQLSILHRSAAGWLEQTGDVAGAIEHLLAAGDLDDAASLIEGVCDALVVTSETTNRFVRWSESLPESALIDHPRIMLSLTQALIVTGKLAGAESLVRTMMAHPWFSGSAEEPEHRQRQAELLAVRSRLAAYRGDDRQTMVLAKIALELLGNDDPAKRASLELDLGFANRTYGQLATAAMHFANASRLGWETGSYQPALWGTRYLALVWLAQGRLREAVALIESDLERVQENGRDGEAIHACLLITQGELRYEQFDLAGARVALETGLELARRTSDAKILMNGYVALALVEMAEDHPDTALLMLRRGMRIFNGRQEAALQAGVALTAGQVAAAQQWMRESGLSVSDRLLPDRGPAEQLTFAKVLLATGESTAAISLLQRLLDAVTERGWQGRAIDIQVVLSGALLRTGQRDAARIMLQDAIRRASPEGIMRPFVASGPEIHGLLREVLRSRDAGLDRDYVTRVMALVANPAASADARLVDTAGLPEALTERQMDVLRLLAAGHTNREIAAALFLAEGTVKAHVFQICAKLLVRNRTEAVARARSLGLV